MNIQGFKKLLPKYIVLMIATISMIFPYIWMLMGSLKTKSEIFSGNFFPEQPQFANFARVLLETPFTRYMFNSIYVSFIIIAIQILGAILAAYVFVTIQKRWVAFTFLVVMAIYMLPGAATYVPSYIIISNLNLIDSHIGYILSEAISIFSIFFLRQSFKQVPMDIVHAARIDGAGHFRLIINVYVPYCRNAIFSLILINFIYSYNNYMWPSLLIKSADKMLVTTGLRRLFMQQAGYGTDWPLTMAACTVSILPMILILVLGNKKIIESMSGLFVNK